MSVMGLNLLWKCRPDGPELSGESGERARQGTSEGICVLPACTLLK
ncbi:MAG TPA: hypothetical protein VNZ44_10180 [Pyrinomonadaceae bacterium]|nr:hypothetical protein [Pyrinomonadaceae bacterium]